MNGNEPLSAAAIAHARVGRTLKEKWQLERLLGMGGMAAVYAARHRNGNPVAVKVLHPELSIHAQIRTRFLREGYAANGVGHRGTVRVLDDDTAEDGAVFLVMELLEGEPLDARCLRAGGTLPVSEVLRIAEQILDVLAAAHDRGIVHRDIKPQNVFLTVGHEVKVLDFGIARLHAPAPGASAMTKSGMIMGTPGFMPPEQARGRWDMVDARSDLWSVGATMFHLLAGRPVHRATTANEALLLAMTEPVPPVASLLPGLAPGVDAIIDRALAFENADRWADARAMQAAVQRARGAVTASASSTIPQAPAALLLGPEPVETGRLKPVPTADTVAPGTTGGAPTKRTSPWRGWALAVVTVALIASGVLAVRAQSGRGPAGGDEGRHQSAAGPVEAASRAAEAAGSQHTADHPPPSNGGSPSTPPPGGGSRGPENPVRIGTNMPAAPEVDPSSSAAAGPAAPAPGASAGKWERPAVHRPTMEDKFE